MKSFRSENMNPEVPGIILLSHGPFAVSLVETASMLFGDAENIAAYSLEPGDDIDQYRESFVKTLNEFPEGTVIMVDLFGGTPCNQVMRHIQETEQPLDRSRNEPADVGKCDPFQRIHERKRIQSGLCKQRTGRGVKSRCRRIFK